MSEAHVSMEALQKLLPTNYTLEKPLAAGSFGQTYLAHTEQAPCVIKMLSLHRSEDWKCIDLFERESKLLKHLDHPHIPNYIDSFTLQDDQETYFLLVQEYVRGKTLSEWLEDGRRFQYAEILTLAWQAADILAYLHSFQPPIIHRDLKPSNFMLDENDKLWIIDFGAVRDTLLTQGTRGSTIIGTFGYMPMEQYEGRAQPASDLYALGMTLIYLLTRQEPSQLPKHQLKPEFRSRCQIPESFARVLDRLVELDLHYRYRSAEKLRQDIAHLQQKQGKRKFYLLTSVLKRISAIRGSAAIAAVLVLFLGALALIFTLGRAPEQSVIALPEEVNVVSPEDQTIPKPWEKLNTRGALSHFVVTDNGGKWGQGYQELYYYPSQLDSVLMWTPQQILDRSHFSQMMTHHNTVYVLGSEKDQKQHRIAYIQDPNAEWQRIEVPRVDRDARLLFVDHQQNLWIAQDKQVWVYDFQRHAWALQFETKFPVYAAAEDDQRQVWLGTVNRLVLWANKRLLEQGSFQAGSISAIVPGPKVLGISTSEGFHVYDPASRQAQHFLAKQKVTGAALSTEGWVIATEKEGLYLLAQAEPSAAYRLWRWSYAQGLPENQVKTISMNANTLAILLEETGVLTMSSPRLRSLFEALPQPPAIASTVYESACKIPDALLSKRSEILASGVSRRLVKDKQVTFFGEKSVCPYPGSFAYSDAVYHFDTESLYTQRNHEIRSAPLPIKSFLSPVDMYRANTLAYFSFPNKGVFRYDQNARPAWRNLDLDGDFFFAGRRMGTDFFAIKRYRSQDAIYHTRDGEKFDSLALPDTLGSAFIYDAAFAPDGKGPLVLGTSQGLVLLSSPEQKNSVIQQFGKESGLPNAVVQKIVVMPEGDVWMSLYKNGVAYYEARSQKIYTWSTREGLISQFIDNLTVDDDFVWLQSHEGRVARYKITDLLKKHAKIQKNTTRNAGS
jgi:serine/threonine protein kinase